MKWAESIFNSTEVFNNFICCKLNNKFSKLYKIAVSFKLNNSDFPPSPFPSFSAVLILGHLVLLQIQLFLVLLAFYKIIFLLNLYLTLPNFLSLILLVTFQSNTTSGLFVIQFNHFNLLL